MGGFFGYQRLRGWQQDHTPPDEDDEAWKQMRGTPAPSEKQGPEPWQLARQARLTAKEIERRAKRPLPEEVGVGRRGRRGPPDVAKRVRGKPDTPPGPPSDGGPSSPVRAVDPGPSEGFDQFIEGHQPYLYDSFVQDTRDGPIEVRINYGSSPLGQYEVQVYHPDFGTEWLGSFDREEWAYDRAYEWMQNHANAEDYKRRY